MSYYASSSSPRGSASTAFPPPSPELSYSHASSSYDDITLGGKYTDLPSNMAYGDSGSSVDTYDVEEPRYRGANCETLLMGDSMLSSVYSLKSVDMYDSFNFESSLFGEVESKKFLSTPRQKPNATTPMGDNVDCFQYLCSTSSPRDCTNLLAECTMFTTPEMCFKSLMSAAMSLSSSDCFGRDVKYCKETSNLSSKDAKINCPSLKPSSRVEKGFAFSLNGSLHEVISWVEQSMVKCSSFSFDSRTTSWSAKCPGNNYFFEVHLFQNEEDSGSLTVEIKRMSGCCVGFAQFYRRLQESILSASCGDAEVESVTIPANQRITA